MTGILAVVGLVDHAEHGEVAIRAANLALGERRPGEFPAGMREHIVSGGSDDPFDNLLPVEEARGVYLCSETTISLKSVIVALA
jgi:hypothetical protein